MPISRPGTGRLRLRPVPDDDQADWGVNALLPDFL